MKARILTSLLVLGSSALLLNCGGSDSPTNTPSGGNNAVGGSAAGGSPGSAGAAAGSAPVGTGGSNALGGGGSGSAAVGGSGGGGTAVGGSGDSSAGGMSQGGTGPANGGAGGRAAGGASSGGAVGTGGGGSFTLSSSKLTAGMAFPTDFTCAGADHSPPFSWGPGPSTTMSYALVLQDTNNNLNHWVLYDIPAATTSLPESLETTATLTMPAGAKQKAAQGMGYLGPCPSGMMHTYTFTLYALDVATLPGVTASSMTNALVTAIQAHDVASATLSATSNAKMP